MRWLKLSHGHGEALIEKFAADGHLDLHSTTKAMGVAGSVKTAEARKLLEKAEEGHPQRHPFGACGLLSVEFLSHTHTHITNLPRKTGS